MSKFFSLLAVLALLVTAPALYAASQEYTLPNQQQLQAYYSKLDEQVQKAQARLDEVLAQMSNPNIMSPALRLDLDVAAQQLAVKQTLANNFIGTPSMRSQVVRDRLLQIMSQDVINQSDLIGLQSLVASEKAKMANYDQQEKAKAKAH